MILSTRDFDVGQKVDFFPVFGTFPGESVNLVVCQMTFWQESGYGAGCGSNAKLIGGLLLWMSVGMATSSWLVVIKD